MSEHDVVEREVLLPLEQEEAWHAACEPDGLREWLAPEIELDLRPGGEGVIRWEDGGEREVLVEEVDPGERIAFRWRSLDDADDPVRGLPTRVEIALEPVEGGTLVRVVESGFAQLGAPVALACGLSSAWAWETALAHCGARALTAR